MCGFFVFFSASLNRCKNELEHARAKIFIAIIVCEYKRVYAIREEKKKDTKCERVHSFCDGRNGDKTIQYNFNCKCWRAFATSKIKSQNQRLFQRIERFTRQDAVLFRRLVMRIRVTTRHFCLARTSTMYRLNHCLLALYHWSGD